MEFGLYAQIVSSGLISGQTVLSAWIGHPVSFYTTVGGGLGARPSTPLVLLFIRRFVFGSFCASACHCSGHRFG